MPELEKHSVGQDVARVRRSGSTARQSASMGQPAKRFRAGADVFIVINKVRENTAAKDSPSEMQAWKIHF